jgi:mono/diheme cytochrome c family protein
MNQKIQAASSKLGVVLALALTAVILSCAGKQTPESKISDPGEAIFNGLTVKGVDCYKCHGGDGTGTWRGANLVKQIPKMTDGAITKAINDGPGMMPAFKGKLSPDQVATLTAWLSARFR